jgi:hypothetical protein
MDETQMRLDGNAAAGMLDEVFSHEMTVARAKCAGCGTIAEIGAEHVYMYPHSPGMVLRCNTCENVLMVVVTGAGWRRMGLQGMTWLETRELSPG